ncbi:MAG: ferrous iron transport protein B [Candidatus Thermoplasmatota archaeon]|nr:ferrous iron transport protein B [Candidatus Thermoplasmatota archaeon]
MQEKKIRIALAGNPNVGKTTLFNAITGSHQHVGNWPGVTVEKKVGKKTFKGFEIEVVDLPGTYSLTAYSTDEVVARNYIIDEKPDVVVHIVDATNLERNLYLTTQLLEFGTRVVIALNMVDIAEGRGDVFNIKRMEEFLETPVVKTVGSTGQGIEELLTTVIKEAQKGPHHEHEIGYGKDIEKNISILEDILRSDTSIAQKFPLRWLSVKLLEGDSHVLEKIKGSSVEQSVKKILDTVNKEEYEAAMADKRYEAINSILPQVCTMCVPKMTVSDMIDRVFTNKYFGIPIFLAMLWGAFELTFTFATPFMDIIDTGFAWLAGAVAENVQPDWLASLLGDGIIGGVGFVLVFIPNIFILFLLLSFLEDSGYMARAAFIMDRLMYKIGLTGKSFIPMLMGFGCNVPAIMATRTIEDKKDRLITILVNPFISCGARLPVFVLLAGAFFGRQAGSVIFGLYVLGIVVAIFSAKLFRSTLFKGKPSPFVMELPPYRLPTIKTGVIHMWERGSMYLKKAGTVILLGALIIWVLASLPWGVEYGSEASYAGQLGHILEPFVAPLGFDWRIAVALLFGFVAKEIVVGALGVLYGAGEDEDALTSSLQSDANFTALTSLGVMVFTLIYMPCLATVGVIKKETGSWKWTLFAIVYGIALAYILVLILYNVGRFIGFGV